MSKPINNTKDFYKRYPVKTGNLFKSSINNVPDEIFRDLLNIMGDLEGKNGIQRGSTDPLNTIIPNYEGQLFYNENEETLWFSTGESSDTWVLNSSLDSGGVITE